MSRFIKAFGAILVGSWLAAPALGEPAMWTLSDEDTTINIIGTVHVLPENTDWRSERIDAAFDEADSVCFELDIVGRALETLGLSYSLGTLKGGDRLVNHLTDEQERDLRAMADEFGIPFTSINVMQPWFASLTIQQYLVEKMGFGEGVEMSLYPDIESQGKALCEMESPQEQLGAFAGMSFEDQLDALLYEPEEVKGLSDEEQFAYAESELNDLVTDWLAGDVAALSETIDEEAKINEGFHNALLVKRNRNWIPRIEAMLEQEGGNFFIAVGAAHLAGEDSVIKMLRDNGHTVKGP